VPIPPEVAAKPGPVVSDPLPFRGRSCDARSLLSPPRGKMIRRYSRSIAVAIIDGGVDSL
jgi:hypothetical protein